MESYNIVLKSSRLFLVLFFSFSYTNLFARWLTVKNSTSEPIAVNFDVHTNKAVIEAGKSHTFKTKVCDIFGNISIITASPKEFYSSYTPKDALKAYNLWAPLFRSEWETIEKAYTFNRQSFPIPLNQDYVEINKNDEQSLSIKGGWLGGHEPCAS